MKVKRVHVEMVLPVNAQEKIALKQNGYRGTELSLPDGRRFYPFFRVTELESAYALYSADKKADNLRNVTDKPPVDHREQPPADKSPVNMSEQEIAEFLAKKGYTVTAPPAPVATESENLSDSIKALTALVMQQQETLNALTAKRTRKTAAAAQ